MRSRSLAALVCPSILILALPPAASAQPVVVETLTAPIEGGSGGITVAPDGTIYVADFGASLSGGAPGTRVFAVTPEGEVRVHAEGLRGASGNELGPGGVLFQSNIAGGYLSRIEPDGTHEVFADENVWAPVGIATAPNGDLLVADCGARLISRVSPAGEVSIVVRDTVVLRCPNGITVADDGTAYIANFGNGDVVRMTPDGELAVHATIPGDNNGHLVHHDGLLYVVARSAHQIYTVGLDGTVELLAGSGEQGLDDGPALEATFSYPNDVGVSPDGRWLYVNDVADLESNGQSLAPMVVRRIRLPIR